MELFCPPPNTHFASPPCTKLFSQPQDFHHFWVRWVRRICSGMIGTNNLLCIFFCISLVFFLPPKPTGIYGSSMASFCQNRESQQASPVSCLGRKRGRGILNPDTILTSTLKNPNPPYVNNANTTTISSHWCVIPHPSHPGRGGWRGLKFAVTKLVIIQWPISPLRGWRGLKFVVANLGWKKSSKFFRF